MITYKKPLNITPGELPARINLSQYDTDFTLIFTLYTSEGELYLDSMVGASIRGTKKDGMGYSADARIGNGVVTINGDVQMTACAGENWFEIVLYLMAPTADAEIQNGKTYYTRTSSTTSGVTSYIYSIFRGNAFVSGTTYYESFGELSTANFILDVERAALDKDTLRSESQIRELVNVIDRTDEIIAAARQADEAVEEVNTTLRGLVTQAEQARNDARQAAAEAANDVQDILQDLVDDANAAKIAAQQAAETAATDAINANKATLEELVNQAETAKDTAVAAAENAAQQAYEQAEQDLSDTMATMLEYKNIAQDMAAHTSQDREYVDNKAAQISRITTDADTIAKQALEKAGNAENEAAETANKLDTINNIVNDFRLRLENKIDDAFLENGLLYMLADGTVVVGPLGPFAGGGGGGGGGDTNKAVITVTNLTGWLSKTIAASSTCEVSLTWSSIEDEMPTGPGTLRVTVNGVVKATTQVDQGAVTVDLAKYCNNGANVCKVQIADIYGNARTINFSVTVTPLSISSNFDVSVPYTGAISFPYIPVGSVLKTVHFILDGSEIGTQQTSVSNRQMSYMIPAQSHGAHTLRVYFDADINRELVRSNELYFEFIATSPLDDTVIIISSFSPTVVDQYSSVVIPYRVYDPTSVETEVHLYINDNPISTQTVDRTEQSFTYRALTAGYEEFHGSAFETGTTYYERSGSEGDYTYTPTADATYDSQKTYYVLQKTKFTISAGTTIKEISFPVRPVIINVEAETQDLALYLNAQGRSNNEETRANWSYTNPTTHETITAQLTNFNWKLDGWQTDDDGINVMRLVDDARITIPYQIFGSDFKGTGKTIEIEFATRQVANYSADILSCFADNIGLRITPQSVSFQGAQSSFSTVYKENEHIRLSITIDKQTANRLMLIYINGVMSRAEQYISGERFSQLNPVGITIGSNECGIDIYNIRIYDNDLNRQQILDNWIADTQIGDVMLDRYTRNQVYNASGDVLTSTLPSNLPYWIIIASELPQFKGDKKTVSGSYTVPGNTARSFSFEGVEIDVQGTSSSVYFRKNYDLKFKQGFTVNGNNVKTYAIRVGSIPFNRFVLKADVASSESANNTELTMFYHDSCPYRTPAMELNPKVRYGIEGIPTAVFWYNPDDQTTAFMGKYNFNLPKRAPAPYGYADVYMPTEDTSKVVGKTYYTRSGVADNYTYTEFSGSAFVEGTQYYELYSDGTLESWEWERNNSMNVKFQDTDWTSTSIDEDGQPYPTWYDDFEARFPSDEHRNTAKLNEFIGWVKSTWRDQATGETLSSPVTYHMTTLATTTAYIGDNSFTVTEVVNPSTSATEYDITFTKDTSAYRLTKFRAEAQDYMEVQSAEFYYLFTELFLMIDSRAKNMFVGFDGSLIE